MNKYSIYNNELVMLDKNNKVAFNNLVGLVYHPTSNTRKCVYNNMTNVAYYYYLGNGKIMRNYSLDNSNGHIFRNDIYDFGFELPIDYILRNSEIGFGSESGIAALNNPDGKPYTQITVISKNKGKIIYTITDSGYICENSRNMYINFTENISHDMLLIIYSKDHDKMSDIATYFNTKLSTYNNKYSCPIKIPDGYFDDYMDILYSMELIKKINEVMSIK